MLEAATTNGEGRASWPPGVVVSGFILYSSFLFDPVPHLVWLSWAVGDTCPEDLIQHAPCGLA